MAARSGGWIVSAMLAAEGVDRVFGIIDGTYFGLYSSFAEHGIELISPRHESSAMHMAGAYARLTGRLGVAIASNGPGVANALPGVAVESGEGNRVLLVTSSRRSGITYPERGGTFQYFDQVGVTKAMTKWAAAVPNRERIPEMMRRAFRSSWSDRPGVVHVDIPESVINGSARSEPGLGEPSTYRITSPREPSREQVDQVARLLSGARRPLIHAGTGVIHARAFDGLQRLAEMLGAPVTTSWGGRGAIDERHPLAVPMILLDTYQKLRNEADVILVLGSRLGETDWWGKAPYWGPDATVIQVDIDDHWIGVNRPVELGIQADLGSLIEAVSSALSGRQPAAWSWEETAVAERAKLDERLTDSRGPGLNPGRVPVICQEVMPEDTVWVFDGGNATVWAQFFHQVRVPNSLLATFKFGMLGAGVAQALGAQVARPDRRVCCVIGDGAMGFHPQELETAVRNDLPVVYVVLVDKQWGMVKMNQQFALKPVKTVVRKSLGKDETINADFAEIRYDDLARSMGGHGERVSEEADLEPALRRALASGKPAVVHVDVDPVTHMWAPRLRAFKDMHAEPRGR